jgi:hypothetical protein
LACLQWLVVLLFTVSVLVAIGSRFMLYDRLRRSGIVMNTLWMGTPGYLERLYWRQFPDPERSRIRWLVLTASVSYIAGFVFGAALVLVGGPP